MLPNYYFLNGYRYQGIADDITLTLIYFVCKLSLNFHSFKVFSAVTFIIGKVSLADKMRIQTGTDR